MSIAKQLTCPRCGKKGFELRMLKDEGVAAVRCVACGRHFLLLDSGDYWFDVIQYGYPRLTRCPCQGEAFRLAIAYEFREDQDVRHVWVSTTCARCGKEQRRLSIDIDYSPTTQLVKRPLVPCQNPQILYDLHELSLFANAADMVRVVQYLAEQGCSFTAAISDGSVQKKLPTKEVAALISKRGALPAYHQIYALPKPLAIAAADISTARKEDSFWKRHEVIRIGAPTDYGWGSRHGSLYNIHFCNQFIAGQKVASKSRRFGQLTAGLVDWLRQEFVTWRGADCFDNPQVHRRVFGDEFQAKVSRHKVAKRK